ncbi:hypothetical protein AVHY2522_17360 [Acidovorax sp. SUPP2522]|uniref:DJ-1/PfpI family protein n=1 Tax=unclassified Acidovorax TaxID=2684926 RepID=UPI0023490F16|nr:MULTISPECIES: DJ-1/PfpI family protein [unclassified Acidovorax]WCM96009.1 DJ-1/PfpI family protein [Acidovorax sp. GBBC 1281]GKT18041.1 hypothetical protein AVHY2522_17360 [Acidovorax sp. SUPP2522]
MTPPRPRRIAYLLYPGFMSLDVVGPLQVFASANVEMERQGRAPAYALQLVAEAAGPVACSAGFAVVADAARCDVALPGLDTLLVPGGMGVEAQLDDPALQDWLRQAERAARRVGSVLLARAGLLDGQPATTHWDSVDGLRLRRVGDCTALDI